MASQSASQEPSPRQTYRVMAFVAVLIILLLGGAIYSLSRMESAPWTSPLGKPDFSLVSRRPVPVPDLKEKLAGRWALISFWSYSCPPCLEEMPSLNGLMQNWDGPELQIQTINVDSPGTENFELAKKFLTEQQIGLPVIFDSDQFIAKAFGVDAYPRHFLVNGAGEIVWEALGAFQWNAPAAKDGLLKRMEQEAPPPPAETIPAPAE